MVIEGHASRKLERVILPYLGLVTQLFTPEVPMHDTIM